MTYLILLFNCIGWVPAQRYLLSNKHDSSSVIHLFTMAENVLVVSELSPYVAGSS